MSAVQRYIKVHKEAPEIFVEGRTQGYKLYLQVTEAVNIDKNLFVFQKLPADTEGNNRDEFTNIASPADIEEYPVGYSADEPKIFYRLDRVTLIFRNIDLLEDAWNLIQIDFASLIESLTQMDSFVSEDVTFGSLPSSSSSLSSSFVAP